MNVIELNDVSIEFPVFNAASRSLKNRILDTVVGARISTQDNGLVTVRGLQDVNLMVKAGERIGILGHNGSGKTTLLRVLSRIYKPTSGHAIIRGSISSLIDMTLGIDPEATGRENIRFRAVMMGMSKSEFSDRIDEIIDFSDLGDFIDMPFRTYSSGMQLRLAFSASTFFEPEILIMDEWLSAGDESFREKSNARLRALVEQTKVLLLASHSRDLIVQNCTRAILLEHGAIKMDGPASDVCSAYFSN